MSTTNADARNATYNINIHSHFPIDRNVTVKTLYKSLRVVTANVAADSIIYIVVSNTCVITIDNLAVFAVVVVDVNVSGFG